MLKQPEILFICGSPRTHTSEALLNLVEQGAKEAGARTQRFLLSQKRVDPCTGCGACSKTGDCAFTGKAQNGRTLDNYKELTEALDRADALAIIAPLYFAGPPAQLKALFDRLQPYWARRYVMGQKPAPKRPAQLFILGGGGDAHGYEPLVTISKSALAVAGFTVEKVLNFVGFKPQTDIEPLPAEADAAQMAFGELAHLRKEVATQKDFEQRAFGAGGAIARFARKSIEKFELQAELQQVEAEIAELKASPPVLSEPSPFDQQGDNSTEYIDVGFEALLNSARESERTVTRTSADLGGTTGTEADVSPAAIRAMNAKKAELFAQDSAAEDSLAEDNAAEDGLTEDNAADISPTKGNPAKDANNKDATTKE